MDIFKALALSSTCCCPNHPQPSSAPRPFLQTRALDFTPSPWISPRKSRPNPNSITGLVRLSSRIDPQRRGSFVSQRTSPVFLQRAEPNFSNLLCHGCCCHEEIRRALYLTVLLNKDSGLFTSVLRKRGGAFIRRAIRGSGSSVGEQVEMSNDGSQNREGFSGNGAVVDVENNLVKDENELLNTLRLVESAMLASAVGLAYFLSNLLRIENYFGCFFPLPPVISSLRWGAAAGRKTMVATAVLLFVLSGPVKAASYLLMHGFVGLAMGTLWRWELNWGLSLLVCTLVRSIGAIGVVLLTSWLLRDNLLSLITINAHASISYMLAAVGINSVPSMGTIYLIFATLLLLNCGSFVFLLHVLYAIFLRRLGIEPSISFPTWLKAI